MNRFVPHHRLFISGNIILKSQGFVKCAFLCWLNPPKMGRGGTIARAAPYKEGMGMIRFYRSADGGVVSTLLPFAFT